MLLDVSTSFIATEQINSSLERFTAWYQALTLTERLAYLRSSPTTLAIDHQSQATTAIRRWKEQGSFKDSLLFAERLLFDAITEQDLLLLLETPIETLSQLTLSEAIPVWLQDLIAALESYAPEDNFFTTPDAQPVSTSIIPFQPLIVPGIERITAGIKKLAQEASPLPFDVATILPLLVANVCMQIEGAVARPLILDLHIARLEGQLEGDTGEVRMAYFLHQLSRPERFLTFLLDYPVLARYLVTVVQQWADYSLEFLHHLCADWQLICQEFSPDADPGLLTEIQEGVGDIHNNGRSVFLLRFSSGFRLVYKPRSLQLDKHFQALLSWINSQGIPYPLRTMLLLDRDGYGWCEFLTAQTCTSEEEVQRFYERQGYYLAILYLLDATDFHSENLLAVGEHPMLIDLESLFHARLMKEANSSMYSVLRIGLLPTCEYKGKEAQGVDISGMSGGQVGQLTPMRLPILRGVGTDEVHVSQEYIEIPARQNRPLLNGASVEVHDYTQNSISGFTKMYHLFIDQRAELQNSVLPSFQQDKVRLIVRATQTYTTYLHGSLHPDCLQDALQRDQLLDHLWDMIPLKPYLKHFIRSEHASLLKGDIPVFHTLPASRDIFTGSGERLEAACLEPSLSFVQRRLAALDEDDLTRQQWIIQTALATTVMGATSKRMVPLRADAPQVSRQQLMQGAQAVGDRLCLLALQDEGRANWLGITNENDAQGNVYRSLEVADYNLYDGTSGIVLFLAYLGAISPNSVYTQMARSGLATIQEQLEMLKQIDEPLLLGAFTGLGSLVYLFSHLASLWQDDHCLLLAEDVLSCIEKQIEQELRLDILAGTAGCLLSLLSLYAVTPSQRLLSIALRCGDHLLTHAQTIGDAIAWQTMPKQPPMLGFAHGAAGIAYSLAKLSAISGEKRFLPAVQRAFIYERSLFSQKEQNWPSLGLAEDGSLISRIQTTWCNGAAGVGLGRLGAVKYLNDPLIYEEIEVAIETTFASGFGFNQSLCHGDLGNLETLLVAAQMFNKAKYQALLTRISAMVFDGIERCGWVTGVPASVETPGLMVGLSGIGYQLLRLAEPERVPSVLLIAPPMPDQK